MYIYIYVCINSHSEPTLYSYFKFVVYPVSHLISALASSVTTFRSVSLANHLRAVADAFWPLRTHQCYWTTERWTSQKLSLRWKAKIYIETQPRCTKQSSSIKQFLETLFLTIKMCTGFTTDGIFMNTMCVVSLANHLKRLADAFRP